MSAGVTTVAATAEPLDQVLDEVLHGTNLAEHEDDRLIGALLRLAQGSGIEVSFWQDAPRDGGESELALSWPQLEHSPYASRRTVYVSTKDHAGATPARLLALGLRAAWRLRAGKGA